MRATLGHYRIVAPLGSGGMGEVYLAEDTKLGRRVALKILPPDLAADADRRRRFEREARAAAALNHPNIVTIHSVEQADDLHFLTMEVIDGQTLTSHIPASGLEWSSFFRLAIQLADAISAAHQQGVVHRDIKPANVMITREGRVKVLDFGIAKLKAPEPSGATTTTSATAPQQVLGTVAYMSPEQAEGRLVDERSDIFSLGVLLHEMATGAKPFKGDTAISVLSSIIKDQAPPVSATRQDAPAELDRIVARCLAKDPGRRYQTAADLRSDLEDLNSRLASGTQPVAAAGAATSGRMSRLLTAAIVVGAVGAGVIATWSILSRPSSGSLRATFTQLTHEPGIEWFPSLSPDGAWITYAGDATGNRDIYLQSVTGQTAINLTQDSPADDDQPAFSPDGNLIAFRSSRDEGGLFVMGRTGEAVRRLTREGFNPAWSPDGRQIAYTTSPTELKPQNTEGLSELWVVDVDGGEPRRLSDRNTSLPSWSPNGRRIAFGVRQAGEDSRLDIWTLPVGDGDAEPVTEDGYIDWNPVWSPDGRYLYFVSNRGGSTNIWRVAIDEASGRTRGEPEPLTTPTPFAGHLTISADGRRLAYGASLETQNLQKLALDPERVEVVGQPAPVTTGSRSWANPDPAPDGDFLVAYSQGIPEGDLYIFRTDGSGASRQLTGDSAIDRVPRWSPDGERIAMFSDRDGSLQIWTIRPDGSDLTKISNEGGSVVAWSPDGTRLAATPARLTIQPGEAGAVVMSAAGQAAASVELLPPSPFGDRYFVPNSWSPDGKWIAGQSWFGVAGVIVYSTEARTFERLTDFGEWPVWLPDSRHVLFVSEGREFHVLDTRTRTTKLLFSVLRDTLGPPRLTRDGRQMFFSRRVTESDVWIIDLR